MDNIFASLLTGNDHYTPANDVKTAIAVRATKLIPNFVQKQWSPGDLDYCYDGNRCKPENLGWRFQQSFGSPEPLQIEAGEFDAQIEATYHEAAGAEYWYRYEKDWG